MMRRILAVTVKELLQLKRDWRTALALLGMPMVLLLIYGFALSFDVQDIRLAVVDQSRTRAAREVVRAFLESGYFVRVAALDEVRPLDDLFDSGAVQATLIIPPDFGADVAVRRPTSLQFVLDGSDSQTANTILGYARQIVAAVGLELMEVDRDPPVTGLPLVWYNPDLRSSIFLVPGLVAFILMVTSVIATALAVVREKERGTMESLLAMPIKPVEIMLGKIAPFVVVGFVQMTIILGAAHLLFGVPIMGSVWLLVTLATLFAAANLAVGYTFSTIAENQLQAVQMTFFFFLPNILLSGFMFPFDGIPWPAQWIAEVLPMTHFMRLIRGVVLRGALLAELSAELSILGIFIGVAMSVAVLRFRTRLD